MLKGSIACCYALLLVNTEAIYRRWLPNTDFGNKDNWNVARAPCGDDVVIIGDESPVVYVQTNTTMKELVLPKTGEIILGRSVDLGFQDTPSEDCEDFGGDIEFIATDPASWMSKDSWCDTTTERGNCSTVPRLDVEYVPCRYDDVIFPSDHGYFVDFTQNVPDMAVKSLKMMGSTFTTQTFSTFLDGAEGKLMFRTSSDSAKLQITRKGCDSKGGCACGNDRPEIFKIICNDAVKKECDRPRCLKSVTPVGMCCPYCGAYFNITKGLGFDLESFKTALQDEFFNDQKDVTNIISVMTGDWVQLFLTDTTGESSKKVAYAVRDAFDADIKDHGIKYAIDGYKLFIETTAHNPNSKQSTASSLSGGSVAGIVISLLLFLIIVGIIVIVLVFRRTGRPLPRLPSLPSLPPMSSVPGLNRISFSGLRGRRVASRGASGQPRTAAHVDPGFANPMYDSSPLDDDFVIKEMEMISNIKEEQPAFETNRQGFQNPLYGNTKTDGDTPGDDATTSGHASMPSFGASTGKVATNDSASKVKASAKKSNATPVQTAKDVDAGNLIVDFSDTAALHSDSAI